MAKKKAKTTKKTKSKTSDKAIAQRLGIKMTPIGKDDKGNLIFDTTNFHKLHKS